ncbi:MAG TPA: hypothetical protein VMU84_04495 [Thermoanaerobaculia bacterium]|nr:hypothetical protein [Thermoanaerobaculia bacterium]
MRKLFLLTLLAGCASSTLRIPGAWLSVPVAPRHSVTTHAAKPETSAIHVDAGRILNGGKVLTETFTAIDSFDVSLERKEVVFSAKRGDNFDVGLVSVDGSEIHWIPTDPADEVAVQWAPRGNKVSYFVRGRAGDVVRTVHIPTAFRLDVGFPNATLHALEWEPAAEHYSVALDSVDASDRVENLRYGGEERRVTVPPGVKLDVEVEPFASDALIVRPSSLRYNERLPLIVWIAAERNVWNDARGALLQRVRAACVVTTREPDSAFWSAARATQWIDMTKVFIVNPANGQRPTANETRITADPTLAAGRYRVDGRVVAAPPAVVESFAAGFIADQLKGTSSLNGSSR